jgi:hypothetical protein
LSTALVIVLATHPQEGNELARKYIRFGCQARGMQALVLAANARACCWGELCDSRRHR